MTDPQLIEDLEFQEAADRQSEKTFLRKCAIFSAAFTLCALAVKLFFFI